MTTLPPHLIDAIAAYTGPVTICPPHQHTEGLFFANGAWHREGIPTHHSVTVNNKAKQRGKATTDHIKRLMDDGHDTDSMARIMGLSPATIQNHIKRIQDDT